MKIISIKFLVLLLLSQLVQDSTNNKLNHFFYSMDLPLRCVNFQEDRYSEGVIHYYSFIDGGSIIIVEGSLLEFPMDNLLRTDYKKVSIKKVDGLWEGVRIIDKKSSVRVYFTNVKGKNKKKYISSIDSIILRHKI